MRKLHLSSKDKMIGGVCGGIAETLGVSSTIIRILFLISIFFGGTGVLVYLIMYLVFPKDSKEVVQEIEIEVKPGKKRLARRWEGRMIAGVCSGLAYYLGIDVSLIRLIFGLSVLFGGIGIIIYIILWIAMPLE